MSLFNFIETARFFFLGSFLWFTDYCVLYHCIAITIPRSGDILCVMSQFGEIEDINLARDEDTGKSRGFAFVKYEDARSCILAVDNLVGIKVRLSLCMCMYVCVYVCAEVTSESE